MEEGLLILWTVASFRIIFIVFRMWATVGLDEEHEQDVFDACLAR